MSYSDSHGPIDMIVVLSVPPEMEYEYSIEVVKEHAYTKVFRFEFETMLDALNFIDTSDEPAGLQNAALLMDTPTDDINAPFK